MGKTTSLALPEQQPNSDIDSRAVWITDNFEIVTDSRWLAYYYGKEHRDVLRAIRDLTSAQNCAVLKFIWREAPNRQKKMQPFVLMDYEAFDLLTGSFTGDARPITQKLKARFRELEQQLAYRRMLANPHHLMEITKMYCEQIDKVKELTMVNEQQKEKITQDAPIIDYANRIRACKNDIPMAVFAETIGYKLKECHDWFMRKGYIVRVQDNAEQGYRVSARGRAFSPTLLKTIQTPLKTGRIALSIHLTPRGQERFFVEMSNEMKEETIL